MSGFLSRVPRAAVLVVVGLLIIATVFALRGGDEKRKATAHFSRAVSLFPGSEVRILGVPVGTVTAVVPEGSSVRVDMEYDAGYDVPADAKAVIVTPTLTADRFVQLTPAYTSGPKLADNADIAVQDTGTPIELDRIYRSLADLTTALGPNGVNKNGTLNNVLGAGAKFLDGQGRKANTMIVNLSRAVKTFGDGSGELFGAVRGLQSFAQVLAANDAVVDRFMGDLGEVSQQLAGEKDELAAALRNLAAILGKVEGFVKGNRELLTGNVQQLTEVLKTIAGEKTALEAILDIGPAAMGNLLVAYDPKSGSIGSRVNLQGNVQNIDDLLCSLVRNAKLPAAGQACQLFKVLLEPLVSGADINAAGPRVPAAKGTEQVRYGNADPASSLDELLGGAA